MTGCGTLRAVIVTAAMVLAALTTSRHAAAAADPVIQVSDRFTTPTPGAPTGQVYSMAIGVVGDAAAKPPVLVREVLQLPPGAGFHPSAIPQCDDTNQAALRLSLMTQPDSACPPGSYLGRDHAVMDPGLGQGGYINADIDEYNARRQDGDEVVFLARDHQSQQPTTVFYGTVTADVLDVSVPFVPGAPPDGRASDRGENEDLPAVGGYRTTPPICPASGQWVSTSTFYFQSAPTDTSGSLQETVHASTPCVATAGQNRRPSSSQSSGASFARGGVGTPTTSAGDGSGLGTSTLVVPTLGGVVAFRQRTRRR